MSKNKHKKKHQFKHVTPSSVAVDGQSTSGQLKSSSETGFTPSNRAAALAGIDNFDYVSKDLKKVMILAISFTALLLALWYTFNHTGLGSSVYNLIKL